MLMLKLQMSCHVLHVDFSILKRSYDSYHQYQMRPLLRLLQELLSTS